jgi:hypothetical protein
MQKNVKIQTIFFQFQLKVEFFLLQVFEILFFSIFLAKKRGFADL